MQSTTHVSTNSTNSATKPRGWLGRNWGKLFFSLVILVVAAGAGGYYYKFGRILTSVPYRQAMDELRKSPQVKKLLGEPIQDGWFPAGSVNTDEGEARLYLKAHGPKTADGNEPTADVSVQARSLEGKWDFTQFDVQPASGPKLNLIEEISASQPNEVPLFSGKSDTPPAASTKPETEPSPDVNIQIPDMPSDKGK